MRTIQEEFDGDALDLSRWSPSYLPAWASRAENAARVRVGDGSLVLTVEPDQGLWCAATHATPLRTSTIATGDWSGPLGSGRGPQPFADRLVVQQEQPPFTGWLVSSGFVEIRCRMALSERSMAALWLAGWDEDPADSGELCVVEVFGDALREGPASAAVGVGIKAKADPRLREDFDAPRLPIDVADWHTYRVDWDADEARFAVDGVVVRRCVAPPTYPMVLMLGVFDFPGQAGPSSHVPVLEVSSIVGTADD